MSVSCFLMEDEPSSASNKHLSRPPPASSPQTFKLRPRSNSHPLAGVAGFSPTAFKPLQHGINTISPDGPIHPTAAARGTDDEPAAPVEVPPPFFAPFFASAKCFSPVKKQKTQDCLRRLSSPVTSPSDGSEDSPYGNSTSMVGSSLAATSAAAPAFPPLAFPSTPTDDQDLSPGTGSSSKGKRSLPQGEDEEKSRKDLSPLSSAFSPRGRLMMKNLSNLGINSPSQTSSVSSTQLSGGSIPQPPISDQNLPNMPTFSFSPSLKLLERDSLLPNSEFGTSTTADSSVKETIVFSAGSTPLGTPKRCPRSSISSTNSSPFHSLRSIRTPIGHQRGSVFKMLPPRLYPNGRDETSSSSTSVNISAASSPFSSASPSPRVVPLTVLSRDGSSLMSPKLNTPQLYDPSSSSPSPLMRSLDRITREDDNNLLHSKLDVKMPNISSESSPMSSESNYLLPRIKLTPRGKGRFLTAKLSPSPRGDTGNSLDIPMLAKHPPRASRQAHEHSGGDHRQSITKTASLFITDSSGDKEAAEMDSLLNGFEHHQVDLGTEDRNQYLDQDALARVESEEAEVAALTQGSEMPTLWLPSSVKEGSDGRRSALTCSDPDSCPVSPVDQMPMSSITLNLPPRRDSNSSHPCGASWSFLPRQVPMSENKSRSLFDSSKNSRDPLEPILRADAIAEAARSNEPLTDEDSDIEGDDKDFLLCLPRANEETHSRSLKNKPPYKLNHAGFRTNSPLLSPSFNKSGNMSSVRRSKFSDHSLSSSPAPTIFEEGFAGARYPTPAHDWGLQCLNKRETSDGTFTTTCSLSDCDVSDAMASPKYPHAKAFCATKERHSVSSMLSMSSLCGLDIVHETSLGDRVGDKVPVLLPSDSSEFPISTGMSKPLRSELSLNSLGLSVDSNDMGIVQRDLFTPPLVTCARNSKQMLSPPPLRYRATSPVPF